MGSKIEITRELAERLALPMERTPEYLLDHRDALDELRVLLAAPVVGRQPLSVWEGAMPESNGKSNFTVILHSGDLTEGICVYRSEYPDRARYEADCFRHLIGDLAFPEKPFICDYDADAHSGYVKPYTAPPELAELQATIAQMTAENERLTRENGRVNKSWHGMKRDLDISKADVERLKGGQGEPVALITVTEIDREYPSPGRNVYVTWLNGADVALSTGDKLYACLDKVKELNP